MSSLYTPHTWAILRVKSATDDFERVFAGWYGGFARGDSWKMNSGIVRIEETELSYDIHGVTGSVYTCLKGAEKMSAYQMSVLASYQENTKGRAEITVVEIKDLLEKYK